MGKHDQDEVSDWERITLAKLKEFCFDPGSDAFKALAPKDRDLLENQYTALGQALTKIKNLQERRESAQKLQQLTLDNETRWMRKHDDLLGLIASLRDWKSPDGVLQVKDLHWFKELSELHAGGNAAGEGGERQKQ
jgi:hypothetical protein